MRKGRLTQAWRGTDLAADASAMSRGSGYTPGARGRGESVRGKDGWEVQKPSDKERGEEVGTAVGVKDRRAGLSTQRGGEVRQGLGLNSSTQGSKGQV